MKYTVYPAIAIVCIALGFFTGRCTTETEVKTEYIRGEPVSGSITNLEPVLTETPKKVRFPLKLIRFS
jgi:hypothetical protein